MTPTMEELKQYVGRYDIVPIQEEIYADVVTPIYLLRKIAASKKKLLSAGKCRRWRKMGTIFLPWIRSDHESYLPGEKR